MKKFLFACCILMGCGATDNVDSTPFEPDSSFLLPDSDLSQDDVVILTPIDASNNLELDASNVADTSHNDAALDHKVDSQCERRDCGEDDRDCRHHNECCNK